MYEKGLRAEFDISNYPFGDSIIDPVMPYLKSLTYSDPANGEADSLELLVYNKDNRWLDVFYDGTGMQTLFPWIGNRFHGDIKLYSGGDIVPKSVIQLGIMTRDSYRFSGSELNQYYTSAPVCTSFNVTQREQTWESVTLDIVAGELAGRYGLGLRYEAEPLFFGTLTQENKTDSAFLYDTCSKYGFNMKIFRDVIYIYDPYFLEVQSAKAAFTRKSFIGNTWQTEESIGEYYTGARVSYKEPGAEEEASLYVGFLAEDDPNGRVVKVNESADSAALAQKIGYAEINKANEKRVTLSCSVDPALGLFAGDCVELVDMGYVNGKYFIDKSTVTISGSQGITQSLELHKIQQRLR